MLVILKGTRADVVRAYLKGSLIWNNVEKLSLSPIMCVMLLDNSCDADFALHFLNIENGRVIWDKNIKLIISTNLLKKFTLMLKIYKQKIISDCINNELLYYERLILLMISMKFLWKNFKQKVECLSLWTVLWIHTNQLTILKNFSTD